jgi:hypothetical protein
LASTVSTQTVRNASATRAVRIVIIIIKYDWLFCILISSCLVCNRAELIHVPILLLRWPGRLNCASMLELLLLRKDVLSVSYAASAEFVSFLVKFFKCKV